MTVHGALVAVGTVAALAASAFIGVLWTEHRAATPIAVEQEVGVRLPPSVSVLAANARLFSLADGKNYEWLIAGSSSLLPWVASVGQLEGPGAGGWSNIRSFQEVSPFEDLRFLSLGLHSVWRIHRSLPGQREETSYLYLAADHTTAVLATFRP